MKRVLVLAVLLAAACNPAPPMSRAGSDNVAVVVETLFTHDGCTIYRFKDGDLEDYHYYAVCDKPARVAVESMRWVPRGKARARVNDVMVAVRSGP